MHASAYLAAALVFAVPTSAIVNPPETLLALNTVQVFGLRGVEYGRFFDASARYAALPVAPAAPAAKRIPEEPFILPIPLVPPLPFERTFARLLRKGEAGGYDALIRSYADRSGLDARLVKAVIAAESEFTPKAKSPAGALGLMQVMPATSREMGVSGRALFEPEANIRAGTKYLAHLFARAWLKYHLKGVSYKDAPAWVVQRVVAAYNAGPRFLAHRKLYRQTRDYIRKVMLFYRSEVSSVAPA